MKTLNSNSFQVEVSSSLSHQWLADSYWQTQKAGKEARSLAPPWAYYFIFLPSCHHHVGNSKPKQNMFFLHFHLFTSFEQKLFCQGYISEGCFLMLTPLRRSALALACLNIGSSFVMVYWCSICSVFALYASWNREQDVQRHHGQCHWNVQVGSSQMGSSRRSAVLGTSWRVWWRGRPPPGWIWCCRPSDGIWSTRWENCHFFFFFMLFKGSVQVAVNVILTSLSSSPAFLAWVMFIQPSASQPTPFIQFRSERYWFCTAATLVVRHLRKKLC